MDRIQNVFNFDGQIRLVGHRHMLIAQDTAVDPIHLEGRSHGHDLLAHLTEGLQKIADGHIGAVGGQDIFILRADEFRVFMQEPVRLRIDRKEFRRNLLQHGIHKFLRQSFRVLIHIIAVHAVAVLHGEDPDGVFYIFIYVVVHKIPPVSLLLWLVSRA